MTAFQCAVEYVVLVYFKSLQWMTWKWTCRWWYPNVPIVPVLVTECTDLRKAEILLRALFHRDMVHPWYTRPCHSTRGLPPACMNCMVTLTKVICGGVCFLINTSWYSDMEAVVSSCSPDQEYLIVWCPTDYLLGEFTLLCWQQSTSRLILMNELYSTTATNSLETKYYEALLVAGDFNHAHCNSVLPKYY